MGADLYESYCGSILASAAWAWRPTRLSEMQFHDAADADGARRGRHRAFDRRDLPRPHRRRAPRSGICSKRLPAESTAAASASPSPPRSWCGSCSSCPPGPTPNRLATAGLRTAANCSASSGRSSPGWWPGSGHRQMDRILHQRRIRPHQADCRSGVTGPATVIIAGVAEGFYSVWVPIIVICTRFCWRSASAPDFRLRATPACSRWGFTAWRSEPSACSARWASRWRPTPTARSPTTPAETPK
jgi:hypothetical protein